MNRTPPTRTACAVVGELERAGRPLRLAELLEALPAHKPAIVRATVDELAAAGHVEILPARPGTAPRWRRVALVRPLPTLAERIAQFLDETAPTPWGAPAVARLLDEDPATVADVLRSLVAAGHVEAVTLAAGRRYRNRQPEENAR